MARAPFDEDLSKALRGFDKPHLRSHTGMARREPALRCWDATRASRRTEPGSAMTCTFTVAFDLGAALPVPALTANQVVSDALGGMAAAGQASSVVRAVRDGGVVELLVDVDKNRVAFDLAGVDGQRGHHGNADRLAGGQVEP